MGNVEIGIEAATDWLLKAEPVSRLTGEEFKKSEKDLITQIVEYFDTLGGKVDRVGIGTVILDRRGAKDSVGHKVGRAKVAAFKAVPDIIKYGQIIDSKKNWKCRNYDTYVIDAPISIGGKPYIAEVILTKKKEKTRYYLHEVEIKEKLQGAFIQTGTETGTPNGASKLIIAQKLKEVKQNSKQALRRAIKARLSSLPPEQFHAEGLKVAALIQSLPIWSQYATILLFLSMDYEIDTQPLLEAAFVADKKIFAPKVKGDDLAFRRIHSPDEPWHIGPYGIREPVASNNDGLSQADFPALIIVPGLAFDPGGNRLGRGRGYYDRFLAGLDAARREYTAIGLCMASQIIPEVPAEDFDKKMDGVCFGH
ncbi:hypothetical protein FACS189476_05210 [Spirochaetia bacterium]|nr:hypothetical protein FACS189476_05210 [Spirochaetia bacterium]